MKKHKVSKRKYLVLYKGQEVLMCKKHLKNMVVECPDDVEVLSKYKTELSDKEKEKGKIK